MPFTGKATYSAGSSLPEIAEDVADLIAINSPHETPLLDALGDASRVARSTVHEWIEDKLMPTTSGVTDVVSGTTIEVGHVDRFRVGDTIRFENSNEIALVTGINTNTAVLTIQRGYGDTASNELGSGQAIHIIGNAALEGADAGAARFSVRSRSANYTQIFSSTVSVSGSELAVNQLAVRDELAWQKNLRSREMLRDLENSVINGVAAVDSPEGTASIRRTMRGCVGSISTHTFTVGQNGFANNAALTEAQLNQALRTIWSASNGTVDLIVVGGREKRAINQFVAANRRFYTANESYKDMVSVYESDFGVCRVVLSRHVPTGTVLLLDSSRISVLPLAGRSFHYAPLARTGDAESGQLVGEYTVEFRNESAHGVIRGFTA